MVESETSDRKTQNQEIEVQFYLAKIVEASFTKHRDRNSGDRI